MKILGIGTDIINIKRMEKSLKKYGDNFKHKVFSKNEIIYCEKKRKPESSYAKRFAAKEALSKALGLGIRKGINFKDIYVINDKSGKPNIKFSNKVNNLIVKKFRTRNFDIFLSLSDEKNYSIAFVTIQKK